MGCADDFRRIQLFVLNGARELRVVSSDAGELKVRVERATRGVRASFGPVEPPLVAFEAGSEFEFLRESRSVLRCRNSIARIEVSIATDAHLGRLLRHQEMKKSRALRVASFGRAEYFCCEASYNLVLVHVARAESASRAEKNNL